MSDFNHINMEVISTKKLTCVILGLAFLALGILGITGWVTMFRTDPIYVNIGEIILGSLGFLVGVYAREGAANNSQATVLSQQGKDIEQQRIELDQLKDKNNQLEKENIKR